MTEKEKEKFIKKHSKRIAKTPSRELFGYLLLKAHPTALRFKHKDEDVEELNLEYDLMCSECFKRLKEAKLIE